MKTYQGEIFISRAEVEIENGDQDTRVFRPNKGAILKSNGEQCYGIIEYKGRNILGHWKGSKDTGVEPVADQVGIHFNILYGHSILLMMVNLTTMLYAR